MLNEKNRLFVKEYLIDLNATQAALRAGYSKRTAYSIGSELLKKPEIAALVQEEMDKRAAKLDITAARVLAEIARLALYDPLDYRDVKSPEDVAALPEDKRRAIVGWKWDKNNNFVLEFAKVSTLDQLGRHLKLFTDKLEVTGDISLAERLKEARERVK